MLDLNFVSENSDKVRAMLISRKHDTNILDSLLPKFEQRKTLIKSFEDMRAKQNKASEEIAKLKREKKPADDLLNEMKELSSKIKDAEKEKNDIEVEIRNELLRFPNMLQDSVPKGTSEEDNVEVRRWGTPKTFSFKAKDHVELGEKNGLLDAERAAKITGSRFTILKGKLASLEWALMNLMREMHVRDHGYTEVLAPFMVNSKALTGTGQLPKFGEDLFGIKNTDYFLIPTAEVPVTNIYADEIIEGELPIKYVAYTPCFRSEAGSYGKDTRGYLRQHQFNKVELVKFTEPEKSNEEHEKLVLDAEKVLQVLGLPYRVVSLCSADTGFGASKCYDIEVWLPGQNAFREISSCSNYEDFQARRANIRYRKTPKDKPRFVHTINGSGLAVGRTLIAVMENYQNEDGSITLPKVLADRLGFDKI